MQAQAAVGLHPAPFWAVVTILVQLGGCLIILSGRCVWVGAGALGLFTAVAAVMAYPFWALQGAQAAQAERSFFDHVGIVSGLLLLAIAEAQRRAVGPARPLQASRDGG